MRTTIDALNALSAGWTMLVASALWQSLLVAVVVALVALAWRRSSPAARYWLWQIVAIKLLLVPLWSWSLALPWLPEYDTADSQSRLAAASGRRIDSPIPTATSATPDGAPSPATKPRLRGAGLTDVTWQSWLLVGWGTIVVLQAVRLAVQWRRLARLLAAAEPADEKLIAAVADVAESLALKRAPRALLSATDCSPFVCRALRPTLVLPAAIVAELNPAELRQVLAHELAHVKRRDLVWGWLPEIARMLYFFYPVAHWASYRIQLQRELACDQLAMAASGRSASEYADTLLRVVSSASRPDLLRVSVAAGLDGNRPLDAGP